MTIVVVGGGLAGGTAVTELRERGYDGRVVLYAAEPHLPYERPPLSKGFLMDKDPWEKALVHDADWYADHDVEVHLGTAVTGIDTAARLVRSEAGDIGYDRLLLATGAVPRTLSLETDVPVAYLRTVEDSRRLKAAFGEGTRVVVVGAGWIGLEVAAAARTAGCAVTVIETAELPLLRVLGPEVARVFADLHRDHGVDLRLGAEVRADDLDADLVVAGVGVVPDTSLAEQAGLAVDNGIVVDARLRTSDPDIYAVGDVANHQHPTLGRLRVEHWDTAIEQAKVAARNLLGAEESYTRMPYFFTDQYDLGMEYVGHATGEDTVVIQGDTATAFRAFWVRDDVVVAGMHVNDWDAIDEIRSLVGGPASAL